MRFYIDFDNTLYSTTKLKKTMLEKVAIQCCKENVKLVYDNILFELKSLFCKDKIYNIFELCDYIGNKYQINVNKLIKIIDDVLQNGYEFVYDDVVEFLLSAKKENKLILLTYTTEGNLEYQKKKIFGSNIKKYFDKIIYTTTNKYTLNINYKDSAFIDDNPEELIGLANTETKKIIRIKRNDCKYSIIEINSPKIMEYENLYFYNDFVKTKQKSI